MDAEHRKLEREYQQTGLLTPDLIKARLRSGQISQDMVEEAGRLGSRAVAGITEWSSPNVYAHTGALWYLQPYLVDIARQCLGHALATISQVVPAIRPNEWITQFDTVGQRGSLLTGIVPSYDLREAIDIYIPLVRDYAPDPFVSTSQVMNYSASAVGAAMDTFSPNTTSTGWEASRAEERWQREYLIQVLLSGKP